MSNTPLKHHPRRQFDFGRVVNIVDGDTLDIEIDLGFSMKIKQRFRLANINTPERGAPGWQAATDFAIANCLFAPVQVVTTKLDKYGRFLAEVKVDGNTITLNQALLNAGLAVPFMKDHDR